MNLRKVKKIRNAVGFHPGEERTYERDSRGTIISTGRRKAYQAAKRAARLAGLA